MSFKRIAHFAVGVCVVAAACLLPSVSVTADGSADLVISQVYGAGGNAGAVYTNDFIEIFNRGTAPVPLGGKSLQYASATGTGNFGANSGQLTVLPNVTLNPGQYFLVKESGGATGAPLPAADFAPSTTINLSGSGGKVALVNSTTTLGCNGGSTPCSAAQLALIIDLVGYDGANFFEGAGAAPTLSAITAAFRIDSGCADTNNNAADFTASAPAPRNTASALKDCNLLVPTAPSATGAAAPSAVSAGDLTVLSVTVVPGTNPTSTGIVVTADLTSIGGDLATAFADNGGGAFSYLATVVASTPVGAKSIPVTVQDAEGRSGSTTIALTITAPVPTPAIHDIQGAGTYSPFAGQLVQTEGLVTAVKTNGFFIQAADGEADGDAATSEGIFVFTSSAPPAGAAVGNRVKVRATVQDFIPASDPLSPPVTELAVSPSVTVLSTGNPLPSIVTLTAADFDPAGSITQLSRYEGMRVHVDAVNVVAPTGGFLSEANATSTSNGIFFGVLPGTARPFREPGIEGPAPAGVPEFDGNPERLRVDSDGQTGAVAIDVSTGASVLNLTGVLDFGSRTYTLLPDPGAAPVVTNNDAHAVPVRAEASEGELTVASFNMQRFYDTVPDPATSDAVLNAAGFERRLAKASLAIRNVLQAPDILGVEEMENLTTLQALAARLDDDAVAAGQTPPNYQASLFEGNDIGGIDVGLLVKTSRINVVSVEQVGKDTTFVQPDGTSAILNDRPPLVLKATVKPHGKEMGLAVTVIVNHLRSLNGMEDPIDGPRIRAKRLAQAQFLATLIDEHQRLGESVVSVGDYNAYDVNDGYVDVINTIRGGEPHPSEDILGDPLQWVETPLIDLAPADPLQHYSYVFSGSAQVLDHIIVSQSLTVTDFTYARNNADFADVLRSDPTRPERLSDHDIPVAYFGVLRDTVPPVVTLTGVTEGATYLLGTVPTTTCSTTDGLSGVATAATLTVTGGDSYGVGEITATCSGAVDNVGNTAAAVSVHYTTVAYTFVGFGAPLGSGVAFKGGSTVPVKFQLRDWNGNIVTDTSVVSDIQVARTATCGGVDSGATWDGAAATGGTVLRFDATDSQFVYNWKTTGLVTGCYTLGVRTTDTLMHTVAVPIK